MKIPEVGDIVWDGEYYRVSKFMKPAGTVMVRLEPLNSNFGVREERLSLIRSCFEPFHKTHRHSSMQVVGCWLSFEIMLISTILMDNLLFGILFGLFLGSIVCGANLLLLKMYSKGWLDYKRYLRRVQ